MLNEEAMSVVKALPKMIPVKQDGENPIIKHKTVSFEKLLTHMMSFLLNYCSKDPTLV